MSLEIRNLRILAGPNVWAACPVLEIVLAGNDADAAQALVAETLRLQEIAGTPVAFSVVTRTATDGVVAAVEFAEEPVGRTALELAVRLLGPEATGPTEDDIQRLKGLRVQARLLSAIETTFVGARQIGVPVCFLSPDYGGFLVLGQGSKQHRIRWAEPDVVSGVGRLASTDKYLTNQLLRNIGIPVPRGKLLAEGDDPWAAASEVGLPVAIKPFDCDMQIGVSLDLRTQDRVEEAFRAALEHTHWVLVEHFAPGAEHRVIVVGDRVVAVTRIEPPHVIGDGAATIAELVATTNRDPRRGEPDSDGPLYKLKLDDVAREVLASQGMTTGSTPAAGRKVLVRRDPPYFKNGGNLSDLTDVIHPATAEYAVAAARMMQIPVAGLDVVAVDIARPLEEQEGIIVEINSNPGLWLHLAPWADSPRPIGQEIAAWLFPDGDGRIPVVAIVGEEGGIVARQLAALLMRAGKRVGTTSRAEMSSGSRRWRTPPGTPQERAEIVFRNPEVDVAVFETDPEELLAHGFAADRCDVAVLLSAPPAARDEDRASADFVRALSHALGPRGTFVTTAAWPSASLGVDATRVIRIAEPDEASQAVARALGMSIGE
ncbi:MAG TPA: hypothetical protein VHR72_10460 [Gemmataceae bacterium]|jgi:cyanophycin synthetase|nr:hypothetical protein [Gemmataceae bacterium]